MFQPLVVWSACFCSGIVAGYYFCLPVASLFAAVAAVFAAAFYFRDKQPGTYLIFCLVFLLGALDIACARAPFLPSVYSSVASSRGGLFVRGIICSDPHVTRSRSMFMMKPEELILDGVSRRAYGELRVESYVEADYRYGDEIIAEGELRRPFIKDVMRGRQPGLMFVIKKGNIFNRIGVDKGNPGEKTILSLKHKIKSIIYSRLKPFYSGVVSAMVLGERGCVPGELRQAMIKTGTWHLMVVSGTHTTVVAGIVLVVLKAVRVGRNARFFLAVVLLVIYCLLTGASSSVVRATVMTTAYLLTYLFKRPPHFLNSLALAAAVILIFDPAQLFQTGFQLSFLSVFFIFWIYPKIKGMFPACVWRSRYLCVPAGCFCVSLSAFMGTAPLLAYVFNEISSISVAANIIVAPLAALVMAGGIALVVFGLMWPPLSGPIASSVEFFVFLFVKAHMALGNILWAQVRVPRFQFFLMISCYLVILYLFRPLPKKR